MFLYGIYSFVDHGYMVRDLLYIDSLCFLSFTAALADKLDFFFPLLPVLGPGETDSEEALATRPHQDYFSRPPFPLSCTIALLKLCYEHGRLFYFFEYSRLHHRSSKDYR